MFYQLSLAKKVHILLIVIALVFLTTTVTFFYFDEKELAESLIEKNIQSTAQSYFDAVNTMMLTGTMNNRQLIQQKILNQPDIVEARIIRSDKVIAMFGEGFADQKPRSDFERQGLAGIQAVKVLEQEGKKMMAFILPLRAKQDYHGTNCLSCHQVKENQILGAVKITYDLSSVEQKIAQSMLKSGLIQLLITLVSFALLSLVFTKLVLSRLKRFSKTINSIEQELDLNRTIKSDYPDELGAVSQAFNRMMVRIKDSFISVSSSSEALVDSATHVDDIAKLTSEAVLSQKNATDSVATAINQLDTSANEVQQNTQDAAAKSISANEKVAQGLQLIEQAKLGIDQLRDNVQNNTSMIDELNSKTNDVGSVLDVITAIAEQTNLLALNAAIEAARAGEQGRGFAVVADEVRSLATRTRESIIEIQKTIGALQVDAAHAVGSMNQTSSQAEEKARDVTDVANLLVEISVQIKELDEMNSQIANATKQQNQAAEEINVNVTNISNIANQSSDDALRGKQISEHLLSLAYDLNKQVSQFKL